MTNQALTPVKKTEITEDQLKPTPKSALTHLTFDIKLKEVHSETNACKIL